MNIAQDILTNLIIQTYLLYSRCLFIFTDKGSTYRYNGSLPIINIQIKKDSINPEIFLNNFKCQGIIIKSSRPSFVFQEFEKHIKLKMERFNRRKIVISPVLHMKENLTDVFLLDEIKYVADLLVIQDYKDEDSEREPMHLNQKYKLFFPKNNKLYKIWTHKYVGISDNSQKQLLDIWYSRNQSFKFNKNLFPNKLLNQMGRVLKLAMLDYGPYSISGTSIDTHKGSELTTAITYSKRYNLTPELVKSNDEKWGYIYENGSAGGVLGNVATDKADLGMGGLFLWEIDYHFLDFSRPIVRSGITLLTPTPKLLAGWLTPLMSFSLAMWGFVILTFLFCILVHFFMTYLNSKVQIREQRSNQNDQFLLANSVFVIFKIFFLQTMKDADIPAGKNGLFFISIVILFSLLFSTSYSSGLAKVMTIPRYEKPIDTVERLVETGMLWYGSSSIWIDSVKPSKQPTYQAMVNQYRCVTDEKLREASLTYTSGFVLERLPKNNYALEFGIKDDVIDNYILMSEDIYFEEAVYMTRKSSILLPYLDRIISRSYEAGIITYWQSEAALSYMDSYLQKAIHVFRPESHLVVKLQLRHVEGAYNILFIGYVISGITFIFEHIVHRFFSKNINQLNIQHVAYVNVK